ncbi:hypothetical protein BGM19_11950 [Streptomyces agglomeratus]|nr:hypothetical protein BGK72_11040 [Streptomyces agglomeratus]OEJ58598.1 hypothetical protein BGM19_11950 [Streptomyces agglomeratus]
MADRRRGTRRRWTGPGPVVALAMLLVSACATPREPADVAARDIQRTLDRRAAAVISRDEAAYLAPLDPAATRLRAAEREEFRNLAQVPLRSWEYRLTGLDRTGTGRATARVELRYRLAEYDEVPVKVAERLDLTRRDGRWYVAAERPPERGGARLWEQGEVTAVRGERSLVLGVGQDTELLRSMARTADRAVPAAGRAWPGRWSRRLVVLVPASLDGMGALLGAPAAGYRGIAAVTTGSAGGPGAASSADRVIVNPEAYGLLGDFGRRIVLTHEATHVATRAHTSAATPMWLSEGFADWAAYRGTGRTAGQAAPELQRSVRAADVPAALPADKDFGFAGDAGALARAYEGGWLACELIAREWGEERLTAFYRAVGGHGRREGAVEKAMHEVLETTPEDFTVRWREYLRSRLA